MMRPPDGLPAVYLCRQAVDFRKGINGLTILVEQQLSLSPFCEQLFALCLSGGQDARPADRDCSHLVGRASRPTLLSLPAKRRERRSNTISLCSDFCESWENQIFL